ncbi:tRNA (adenine(37)-N6)-methyltransferase [Nothobranchius furzeri]|uniref:tRNA (adenine(37)-N6)-methyltransferase n=2 Tax=Nothobranchius furzeri TaxID=105023 RepID=A0A9D2YPL5_NOTFU|nr:tRNA (adenine(37)-N6)-methyltransferase [Nothobranchius furzeri]KAF7223593.1 tRNA methyltransferase O [Nothobranchius furzeri]
MSPQCECCGENITKLNQQVSVMRTEIKNLRQMLDSSVRAHRKQLAAVQAVVSKAGSCEEEPRPSPPSSSAHVALEQGSIQTTPIGFIISCFSVKNGTPRQPNICSPSRAELRIQRSVFNNPEHALLGLDRYSHVWIIFLFHKNGHLSYKAKVKPPRLNGQRVGVYSTRSPHRPNAVGLTLARLDKIEGDTLHLSDIDMIDGTPVLDIKPFIPEYDSPEVRINPNPQPSDSQTEPLNKETNVLDLNEDSDKEDDEDRNVVGDGRSLRLQNQSETDVSFTNSASELCRVLEEVKTFVAQDDMSHHDSKCKKQVSECKNAKRSSRTSDNLCYGEQDRAAIASWIRDPPVSCLDVRFTPHAEEQLAQFLPAHLSELREDGRPRFKFLHSSDEAVAAIRGVLSADPRSVYRRTRCRDKLFFFTIDTADITCWFGHGFVEVLQVRPVGQRDVTV